jgi:hypothetical protein
MCADCDKKIHNKGKRAKHVREDKFEVESFATLKLKEHDASADDICETDTNSQSDAKTLPQDEEIEANQINGNATTKNTSMTTESSSFKRSISDGCRKMGNPPQTYSKYATLLNLKNAKSFIPMDKRKHPNSYFPQLSNYPASAVNSSVCSSGAKYKNRNCRPNSSSSMGSTTSSVDYTPYYDGGSQMSIPMYQPYVKIAKTVPQSLHDQIFELQQAMRKKAEEGHLMIEEGELEQLVGEGPELFRQCEQYGIIHTIERQFGNRKQIYHSLKMEVISLESIIWCLRSLKVDEMTPNEKAVQSRIKEAFSYKVSNRLWDKIMEAIKTHSKIQSAQHNHAGSNPQSSSYFHQSNKTQRYQHLHCSEDYEADKLKCYGPLTSHTSRNNDMSKIGGSFRRTHSNRKYIPTRSGKKLYHINSDLSGERITFELEEDTSNIDCNTSTVETKSYLIFPSGESWIGVDGKTNNIDPEAYKIFVSFLEEYFTGDLDEFWSKYSPLDTHEYKRKSSKAQKSQGKKASTESTEMNPIGMPNSTFDENTRAIPGGRYGCAQFVKSCGPPLLRALSLGKFSQMIQQAISEDLLRYQK